jgi:ABC-type phosphate/phosphonate transport system permease subunit
MIDYAAASTVLLVTVVMVMVVDFASARIRARLV